MFVVILPSLPGSRTRVEKRNRAGRETRPEPWCATLDQSELETEANFEDALPPSWVTAAMQTTAIRATSRAYSTREAARSLLVFAWIQAEMNS